MEIDMLLIQNDIANEFLSDEEVAELTGAKQLKKQMDWLKDQGWQFSVSGQGRITIGRWYARMKMSGVALHDVAVNTADMPNFDKVS